jgi:pyrimidine-nucleoside phosphorylase
MWETRDLSIELTAHLLVSAGIAENLEQARIKCEEKIRDGSAYELMEENIYLQDGDSQILSKPEILIDDNLVKKEIRAQQTGFICEIDTKIIGKAISEIGGGRAKMDDVIDFAVGYECLKKNSDEIREGEPLGILYCRKESQANRILEKLQSAYQIGEEKPEKLDLVQKIIS